MTRVLPTLAQAKSEARQMRAEASEAGTALSHAQALEAVAHRLGFRDWNGLYAASRDCTPQGWTTGGRVTGRYLSHPFAATVLSADRLQQGWFKLVLDLDEAVDVVTFESFSNLRKRIRVDVGPDGYSKERTSDGVPHMQLDL